MRTISEAHRAYRWLVPAILALALLWSGIIVAHSETRRPWNDEAMLATPGMNLVQHGHFGVAALEPKLLPNVDRRTYLIFPFGLLSLAGWYKLVGFSLLSVRLFSALWTILLIVEVYILARYWSGSPMVGIVASILCAFDYSIMVAASFGRYDPMVAALGFGAYASYLILREKSQIRALVVSNALIALCGATHPNGLMFLCGLVYLVYRDRKSISLRALLVSAVPYGVVAAVWGAYLLQDLPSAIQQLKIHSYSRISLFQPLTALAGEIGRYRSAMGLTDTHSAGTTGPVALKAVPWLVYFAGAIGVVANRTLRVQPGIRVLLGLSSVHLLYFTFFEGIKFPFYLEEIIPLYVILVAVLARHLWMTRTPSMRLAVAGACGIAVLIGIGGLVQRIRINTYDNMYAPAVEFVRKAAKPTDLVMASCDFGFGYGFRPNLVDDIRIGYYSGKVPQFIVVEESYVFNFEDWKVTDPKLSQFITNRLSEYDVVYDQASYRVYRRRLNAEAQPEERKTGTL